MIASSLRILILLLFSALLLACEESSTDGTPPTDIILSVRASPGSLPFLTAEKYVANVNEELPAPYQLKFREAGSEEQTLDELKSGNIQLAMLSTSLSKVVPAAGLFELPFLVQNRGHARRIAQQIFWPQIAPEAEKQGYKVLAFWEEGMCHFSNSIRPIYAPTDLQKIRIGTPNSPLQVQAVQDWGAEAIPLAYSAIRKALDAERIDGLEMPLTSMHATDLHTKQKYLSLSSHIYTPAYLLTSTEQWAAMPNEIQQVLAKKVEAVTEWMLTVAKQQDEQVLNQLIDAGMNINTIDRDLFIARSQNAYARFKAAVPQGAQYIQSSQTLVLP